MKVQFKMAIAIFILSINIADSFGQGAGSALQFNGSNEYVRVNHNSTLNLTTTWTIECWIKPDVIPSGWDALVSKGVNNRAASIWLYYNSVEVWYGSGTNGLIAYTNYGTVSAGEWQHVAATRDGSGTVRIYINGVLEATVAGTSVPPTNSNRLNFGQRGDGSYYYDGSMDEVRYWNVARSQTEIRENMCKSLSGAESGLVGYWKLDEGYGGSAGNETGGLNGSLRNTPTWITSGAPVGNDVSYLFTGSWTGQTVSLSSPEGDGIELSNITGSPDGVIIYRVDNFPNTLNGTIGVGDNDHYFGIFKANASVGSNYQMTYTYSGNAAYEGSGVDESELRIYKRNDNSITSWTEMTSVLDLVLNTLTGIGENTEYILGTSGTPLPVELLSFDASLKDGIVDIEWKTATELNNDYFNLERSSDGENWILMTQVKGHGNSREEIIYNWSDTDPVAGNNYYRLIQTDYDGTTAIIDPIVIRNDISAGEQNFKMFPNPTNDFLTVDVLEPGQMEMFNASGGHIITYQLQTGTNRINVSDMDRGLYMIQIRNSLTHQNILVLE